MALNVLIVDDSKVMRSMVLKTMKMAQIPLGDIIQAGNGKEGLDALSKNWIDLVLVDINMPVMNGEDMIRQMKTAPETADIPVVVISTEGSETRIARLKEMGAAFVHKPFAPEEIRDTIYALTGIGGDDE